MRYAIDTSARGDNVSCVPNKGEKLDERGRRMRAGRTGGQWPTAFSSRLRQYCEVTYDGNARSHVVIAQAFHLRRISLYIREETTLLLRPPLALHQQTAKAREAPADGYRTFCFFVIISSSLAESVARDKFSFSRHTVSTGNNAFMANLVRLL